jgi:hypothetical protein
MAVVVVAVVVAVAVVVMSVEVNLDCMLGKRDGPEDSLRSDAGVEVMLLVRKIRGRRPLKDVESNEGESALVLMPVSRNELANEEPVVNVEGEVRLRRFGPGSPHTRTGKMSRGDRSVEIRDRELLVEVRRFLIGDQENVEEVVRYERNRDPTGDWVRDTAPTISKDRERG